MAAACSFYLPSSLHHNIMRHCQRWTKSQVLHGTLGRRTLITAGSHLTVRESCELKFAALYTSLFSPFPTLGLLVSDYIPPSKFDHFCLRCNQPHSAHTFRRTFASKRAGAFNSLIATRDQTDRHAYRHVTKQVLEYRERQREFWTLQQRVREQRQERRRKGKSGDYPKLPTPPVFTLPDFSVVEYPYTNKEPTGGLWSFLSRAHNKVKYQILQERNTERYASMVYAQEEERERINNAKKGIPRFN